MCAAVIGTASKVSLQFCRPLSGAVIRIESLPVGGRPPASILPPPFEGGCELICLSAIIIASILRSCRPFSRAVIFRQWVDAASDIALLRSCRPFSRAVIFFAARSRISFCVLRSCRPFSRAVITRSRIRRVAATSCFDLAAPFQGRLCRHRPPSVSARTPLRSCRPFSRAVIPEL